MTDLWECWKSQEERSAWPAQPEILKQETPKPGERAVNMLDRPFERWLGGRRKLAFTYVQRDSVSGLVSAGILQQNKTAWWDKRGFVYSLIRL